MGRCSGSALLALQMVWGVQEEHVPGIDLATVLILNQQVKTINRRGRRGYAEIAEENVMPLSQDIRPKEDLFCPYGNATNPLENFDNLSCEFLHSLEKDFIIFLHVLGFQEQILSS